jgi:phosphate transport system protein
MSRHLEVEIEKLKRSVLAVAGAVEESLNAAVQALQRRDRALALQVIESDGRIDHMEVDVEEECLKVLALHQPLALDLRFIVSVLKINNDLERIADLAVNIGERAAYLATVDAIEPPFDLSTMASKTVAMLNRSLDALVKMDAYQARAITVLDDEVDAINRDAFIQVQNRIRADIEQMDRLIHYLSVARHLERIADLATNIAEDVVYLVEGVIIRHRAEDYSAHRPQYDVAD